MRRSFETGQVWFTCDADREHFSFLILGFDAERPLILALEEGGTYMNVRAGRARTMFSTGAWVLQNSDWQLLVRDRNEESS